MEPSIIILFVIGVIIGISLRKARRANKRLDYLIGSLGGTEFRDVVNFYRSNNGELQSLSRDVREQKEMSHQIRSNYEVADLRTIDRMQLLEKHLKLQYIEPGESKAKYKKLKK